MKLFILYILIFLPLLVTGQPYLNHTSFWKQYYTISQYPPGIVFQEDRLIRLVGDTIIDGKEYYKVLKTGWGTTYYLTDYDTIFNGPIHANMDPIREEGPIIYYYDLSESKEYVLYDFGGTIGDSLLHACGEIVSIDTLYLGSRPLRQFHFPFIWGEISTLVEGIGSTFGLYWWQCNDFPWYGNRLQCYGKDGDLIQFDPEYDCAGLLLSDKQVEKDVFTVYPNPFTNEVQIDFTGIAPLNTSLQIINLWGVVVFEKHIPFPDTAVHIDLSHLQPGFYIIRCHNRTGEQSIKIVKN